MAQRVGNEPTTTWVPAVESFGSRLALLRHHLNLSVKAIAALCGLDDASWSNWERGTLPRNMPKVVDAIFAATGADRDWLMWGDETPEDVRRDSVGYRVPAGQAA